MTDLYAVLGVERGADKKVIRAAYRTLAKTKHPDVGGDEDQFKTIKLAHDVLTDEDRRARYDQTGAYEDAAVDNTHSMAMNYLSTIWAELMAEPEDPTRFDYVKALKDHIKMNKREIGAQRPKIKAKIEQCEKMRGRIMGDPKKDVLNRLLEQGIAAANASLANLDNVEKMLEHASELIEHHSYRVDVPPPAPLSGGLTAELWRQMSNDIYRDSFFGQFYPGKGTTR